MVVTWVVAAFSRQVHTDPTKADACNLRLLSFDALGSFVAARFSFGSIVVVVVVVKVSVSVLVSMLVIVLTVVVIVAVDTTVVSVIVSGVML